MELALPQNLCAALAAASNTVQRRVDAVLDSDGYMEFVVLDECPTTVFDGLKVFCHCLEG